MQKLPVRAARPGLFEAKQETVRNNIGEHAIGLFAERGYDATTVEEIARVAGIGRRTFFRYFETKDDVVLWRFDQFARHAVALLEGRPAREPGLTALERALIGASAFYVLNPEQTAQVLRMTEQTPSLFAQQLAQQDRWKSWFADVLRARGRHAEGSVVPELTAAAGLEAMAFAVRCWARVPSTELHAEISRAFAALRKVVGRAS